MEREGHERRLPLPVQAVHPLFQPFDPLPRRPLPPQPAADRPLPHQDPPLQMPIPQAPGQGQGPVEPALRRFEPPLIRLQAGRELVKLRLLQEVFPLHEHRLGLLQGLPPLPADRPRAGGRPPGRSRRGVSRRARTARRIGRCRAVRRRRPPPPPVRPPGPGAPPAGSTPSAARRGRGIESARRRRSAPGVRRERTPAPPPAAARSAPRFPVRALVRPRRPAGDRLSFGVSWRSSSGSSGRPSPSSQIGRVTPTHRAQPPSRWRTILRRSSPSTSLRMKRSRRCGSGWFSVIAFQVPPPRVTSRLVLGM